MSPHSIEEPMKTIRPAVPAIAAILGEQKKQDGTAYRLTRHCYRIPCEDGTLLFHTLTGELVLLEGDKAPEDHVDELLRKRFFVPEDFDEEALSQEVSELLKKMNRRGGAVTSYTILTTTDCNARCYYCYEMGRRRLPMSDRVAHDAAAYIVRRCCGKPVTLHWFGGEPLYHRRAIELITDDLRKAGIPFHSRMISNGYYLDNETCTTAVSDWNLKKVQITLDGTKERYQRAKAFIEQDPYAFERVLNNIGFALDHGIYVAVRLNVDRSNAEDLHELVRQLAERFGEKSGFHVYAAPLRQFVGKIVAFEDEMKELEAYESLNRCIDSFAIGRVIPFDNGLRVNRCMADTDSSEVLLPDGRIGKCEHYSETNLIGSIYHDERDEDMIREWKEVMPHYPECSGCPLYPRCRQLVKCDYTESRCRKAERLRREHVLQGQMLDEYRKYKLKA